MANNQTKYTFLGVDKFTRIARQIRVANWKLKKSFKRTEEEAKALKERMDSIGTGARRMAAGLAVASAAILLVGGFSLRESAKMETLFTSFDVLIGKTQLATETFEELKSFAAKTPFRLQNLAEAGRMLLSAEVPAAKLTNTLRQLGELSAGSGKPLKEFALVFAKIKTLGVVQGEEMRQLLEKSVNIRKEIAAIFSEKMGREITTAQVSKAAAAGLITFEHFQQALDRMTNKGGRFFGLTDRLSQTMAGLWSTVTDNLTFAGVAFGDALVKSLDLKKGLAKFIIMLQKFTLGIESFAAKHPIMFKTIAIFAGLVVVLLPLTLAIAGLAAAFAVLAPIAAAAGISVGVATAAVFAIPLGIAAIVAAGFALWQNWDMLKEKALGLASTVKFGLSLALLALFPPLGIAVMAGQALWKTWNNLKTLASGLLEKILALKNAFQEFAGGKMEALLEMTGLDINSNSQHNIDIGIRTDRGAVESVSRKSSGMTQGMNVGLQFQEVG